LIGILQQAFACLYKPINPDKPGQMYFKLDSLSRKSGKPVML
jgi:hypothetical protein